MDKHYIMTKKGMKRASADVGLIMTVYYLHRIMNILGAKLFKKYLKVLALFILNFVKQISSKIRRFIFQFILLKFTKNYFFLSFNRLIFD
ncbi:MAG: hypothetical protein A2X08_09320 [Bacteroidetes bacterium GWA2_32_17]|nr:MAG: hypothetical protein A2X08_09320 [Bacteroidetes bacterium GWA2_32_17]